LLPHRLALIAEKSDMLDSLVEMEIAQSLLSASAVGHEGMCIMQLTILVV
jgi:hypothetical protein